MTTLNRIICPHCNGIINMEASPIQSDGGIAEAIALRDIARTYITELTGCVGVFDGIDLNNRELAMVTLLIGKRSVVVVVNRKTQQAVSLTHSKTP